MAAAMLVGVSGCRKYSGEEAAQKRADWTASLHDSIAQVAAQRHTDSLRIEQLRAEMAENISRFTMVNNPREVEPYYILSAFKSQYPLKSTGIAARMMKNEQAEIIAALSGGRFNAIRVTSPQGEVTSAGRSGAQLHGRRTDYRGFLGQRGRFYLRVRGGPP